jgi:hypothetical protein
MLASPYNTSIYIDLDGSLKVYFTQQDQKKLFSKRKVTKMNQVVIEIKLQQPQRQKKHRPTCPCKGKMDSMDLAGEALLYFASHRFTPTQKKDFWKAIKALLTQWAEERKN